MSASQSSGTDRTSYLPAEQQDSMATEQVNDLLSPGPRGSSHPLDQQQDSMATELFSSSLIPEPRGSSLFRDQQQDPAATEPVSSLRKANANVSALRQEELSEPTSRFLPDMEPLSTSEHFDSAAVSCTLKAPAKFVRLGRYSRSGFNASTSLYLGGKSGYYSHTLY